MSTHPFIDDQSQYTAFCHAITPQSSIATFNRFNESDIPQVIALAKSAPLSPLTYTNDYIVDLIGREPLLFDDHPETAWFKQQYNKTIQVQASRTQTHFNIGTVDLDNNLHIQNEVAREYIDTRTGNEISGEIAECYSDNEFAISEFTVSASQSKRLGIYDGRIQHLWCKEFDLGWRVTFTSHYEHVLTGNKIYVFFPLSNSIQNNLFMEGENISGHNIKHTRTSEWFNKLSMCKIQWANVLTNQCIYIPAGYRYNSFPIGHKTAHNIIRDQCSYMDGLYLVVTRMYVVHVLQDYKLCISRITSDIVQALSYQARHTSYSSELSKRFHSLVNKCVNEISHTLNLYGTLDAPDAATLRLLDEINTHYDVQITFDGLAAPRISQRVSGSTQLVPLQPTTQLDTTVAGVSKRERKTTEFYTETIPQKRIKSAAQKSEQLASVAVLTRGQLDTKTANKLKKITRYTFRDMIVPFMSTLRLRDARGVTPTLQSAINLSQQIQGGNLFMGQSINSIHHKHQVLDDLLQLQRIKGAVTNARMDILFEQGWLYRLYVKNTKLPERIKWLREHHLPANNYWNNLVNLYQLTREYPNFRFLDFADLPVEVTESTIIHNAAWFRGWLRDQFRLPHRRRPYLDILRTPEQARLDGDGVVVVDTPDQTQNNNGNDNSNSHQSDID